MKFSLLQYIPARASSCTPSCDNLLQCSPHQVPPEPSQVRNITLTSHRIILAPSSFQSLVHNRVTTGVSPPSLRSIGRYHTSARAGREPQHSPALSFLLIFFCKTVFQGNKNPCSTPQHHDLPRQTWHHKVVFLGGTEDCPQGSRSLRLSSQVRPESQVAPALTCSRATGADGAGWMRQGISSKPRSLETSHQSPGEEAIYSLLLLSVSGQRQPRGLPTWFSGRATTCGSHLHFLKTAHLPLHCITLTTNKEIYICVCVAHMRVCCVFPANTCQDLFKPRFMLKCHPARIHYVPFIN